MGKKQILLCYVRLDQIENVQWDYIGLFYLAGALERRGYAPMVWHGDWRGLKTIVSEKAPDAVGFSVDAENQRFIEDLIPAIRDLGRAQTGRVPLTMTGGPQAMALGEAFLRKSGCDFVIRGEGEETLPALLDAVWGDSDGAALRDIPGLCWLDADGRYRENAGFGVVEDLSTLPRPAYHASLHRRIYGRTVFTGRSCPFNCAFCASHVGHGRLRTRDMDDVLSEIRENLAREPGIRYIIVQDDTFCINPDRVSAFCRGMREIRRERPVVWFCETHVHTLLSNPALLKEMIDSGLYRLQIGMESGDPRVLRLYNKKVTPDEMLALVKLAVGMGLPEIAGNFIVGGPREEPGLTERFMRELLRVGAGVVDLNTGFLRSYPFTAISEDPAAFGLRITASDITAAGNDYPSVIPVDATEQEIVQLRQRLNRAIREEMGRLLEEHAVPTSRVLKQLEMNSQYGLSSRWMMELTIPARAHIHEYYKTLYLGEGQPWPQTPPDPEAMKCHYPQRTFEFYRSVILSQGVSWLFGMVLSPLEYDLLFYSAGKLSMLQIVNTLWEKYSSAYDSREEFVQMVDHLLRLADERFWITTFYFEDALSIQR